MRCKHFSTAGDLEEFVKICEQKDVQWSSFVVYNLDENAYLLGYQSCILYGEKAELVASELNKVSVNALYNEFYKVYRKHNILPLLNEIDDWLKHLYNNAKLQHFVHRYECGPIYIFNGYRRDSVYKIKWDSSFDPEETKI